MDSDGSLTPNARSVSPTTAEASPEPPADETPTKSVMTDEDDINSILRKVPLPKDDLNDHDYVPNSKSIVLGQGKRSIPYSAINSADRSGRTPIFKYCSQGDFTSVISLIKAGADVNIRDNGIFLPDSLAGWSPLHEAAFDGELNICKILIKYGADVNSIGFEYQTPLHDAVANGHIQVVELLLQHGAYLAAVNKQGESPLELSENDEMTNLLNTWKLMGEKVIQVDNCVDYPDFAGWTPLHESCNHGFFEITEVLLKYGAQVDAKGGVFPDGKLKLITPLMDAANRGDLKIVRLLLQYNADPELECAEGKRAIHYLPEGCNEIMTILELPKGSVKPSKKAEYIKTQLVYNGMMTSIRDEVSKRLAESEAKTKKTKTKRKNSITSETSQSTNANGSTSYSLGSKGVISVSAATAAAVGLGGPNAFSWGGLDPREREGPFASSREERKFNALLQTLGVVENTTHKEKYKDAEHEEEPEVDRVRIKEKTPVIVPAQAQVKRKVGRPPKVRPEVIEKPPDLPINESDSGDEAEKLRKKHKKSELVDSKSKPAKKKSDYQNVSDEDQRKVKKPKTNPKQQTSTSRKDIVVFSDEELEEEKPEVKKSLAMSVPPVKNVESISKEDNVIPMFKQSPALPAAVISQPSPVKKKPKKKNLFGISGYQRLGEEPAEEPVKVSQPISMPVTNENAKKCLPIYIVKLPVLSTPKKPIFKKYIIDLQMAFFLGKKSGREFIEMHPSLETRVATAFQKQSLSASPVAETILNHLESHPITPKWIKSYERNGTRGLRMQELDILFIDASVLNKIECETCEIDLESYRDVEEVKKSVVGGYVHKLKRV